MRAQWTYIPPDAILMQTKAKHSLLSYIHDFYALFSLPLRFLERSRLSQHMSPPHPCKQFWLMPPLGSHAHLAGRKSSHQKRWSFCNKHTLKHVQLTHSNTTSKQQGLNHGHPSASRSSTAEELQLQRRALQEPIQSMIVPACYDGETRNASHAPEIISVLTVGGVVVSRRYALLFRWTRL